MEFQDFPKISRLTRNVVVTEKIDGTNAQIEIITLDEMAQRNLHPSQIITADAERGLAMLAGSRTRYITPGADNFGFARWALDNAADLFSLGTGRHFGEWWGSGIQRGCGLQNGEKRWSLFNVSAWADRHMGDLLYTGDGAVGPVPAEKQAFAPACCYVVPTLYTGVFDTAQIDSCLTHLGIVGSKAAPGFMKPEGVVVFHTAAGQMFKKTIERDEEPKSQPRHRNDRNAERALAGNTITA